MRIAIGSDHAGVEMKEDLARLLRELGHEVVDADGPEGAALDYPDAAVRVAEAILGGRAARGILLCGSGVGASVAANKVPGIRAGLCHDAYTARQAVEHDDLNVLVLGARVLGRELARELVRVHLAARFTGEERHLRRLEKVRALEERYGRGSPAGEERS